MDEAQIIEYAREFDPQPFHLDASEAESSFFGGLAASGWHTASITMRLLVDSVPIGNGVIGAGGEIAWPRPTRPTDVLHVVSTIREIRPSRSRPDRGIVTMECLTLNQDGETCQRFVPQLVVLRRGEDA
nr:MaoC family dehydratase [Brachybacterium fresconis]